MKVWSELLYKAADDIAGAAKLISIAGTVKTEDRNEYQKLYVEVANLSQKVRNESYK